jgi:hypothetical protein
MMQLKDKSDYVTYQFIYKLFTETIDKHHKKDLNLKDKITWSVELYIDACHSGSALQEAIKYAENFEHKKLARNGDNNARYKIGAFDEKVKLELHLMTSATGEQLANDAGLGRGSKWTNHYLAKGKYPNEDDDAGKLIIGVNKDRSLAYQTT